MTVERQFRVFGDWIFERVLEISLGYFFPYLVLVLWH